MIVIKGLNTDQSNSKKNNKDNNNVLDSNNHNHGGNMDTLDVVHYFSSSIYAIKKMEFLDQIRDVSKKFINKCKCGDNPMTVMTSDFSGDPDAKDFAQYVSQTAWNILQSQGYNMEKSVTFFTEMWTQEHNYQSSMDSHMHGYGVQMSAFYFLDVPENSSVVIFHDPRPAKVIINLPELDDGKITTASNSISFVPVEGTIMFVPPYVAHQFTRNLNTKKPMRFVHMNLGVALAPEKSSISTVEKNNTEVI